MSGLTMAWQIRNEEVVRVSEIRDDEVPIAS